MEVGRRGLLLRALISRHFLLAFVVNCSMGIIYVWSLFLLPLEEFLGIARSSLSAVPAISLVSFTIGMVIHDHLLRRLSLRGYAILAFGLAGGGYALFSLISSFRILIFGYGLLFGFGSGLGYGLALALVMQMPVPVRSIAVGAIMAAFAVSGVTLSSLLAEEIRHTNPSHSFGLIGAILMALGILIAAALPSSALRKPFESRAMGKFRFDDMTNTRFMMLGTVFFFICYTGLMVVAHATGIFSARNLPQDVVGLAPGAFTFGYIVGSSAGAKLVEALSGIVTLMIANVVAGVGLVFLLVPASPLMLTGTVAIGMVFGGSASGMPVLIGELYGAEKIGDIYGKLMIAYGMAGLLAPWISGQFFSASGDYTISIGIGIAMCIAGVAIGFALKQTFSPR